MFFCVWHDHLTFVLSGSIIDAYREEVSEYKEDMYTDESIGI